jgi:hypothetical protein
VVLPALTSGSELAYGHEQVDIVGADKVLSHVDNGGSKTHFPVMVGRVFSHVALQLSHFDFRPQVPLETGEQAVHHRRDRPHVGVDRIVDHFFVHKLTVPYPVQSVVDVRLRVIVRKPLLSLVCLFAIEKQIDFLLVLC